MRLIAPLALVVLLAAQAVLAEPKLDPSQQQAVDKLKAKGALVMPLAADSDGLVVSLALVGKGAGDAELALVKTLPKVAELNLAGTGITDAGLANIEGMNTLAMLHLEKTGIGDAGLAHLKGLTNLTYLNLYNTAVTDQGVKQLEGLKTLRKLYLWETKVTDVGAASLRKANPELMVNRGEEAKAVAAKADQPKPINTVCPVSGKPVDPTHTLVYEGKTVGFCCDKCPVAFQKEPQKYASKLALAAPASAASKPEAKPAEKKPEEKKPAESKGEPAKK